MVSNAVIGLGNSMDEKSWSLFVVVVLLFFPKSWSEAHDDPRNEELVLNWIVILLKYI